MKRYVPIAAACAALGASAAPALAGEIDLGLEEVFDNTPQGEVVSALVYMMDQGDIDLLAAHHQAQRVSFERRNEEVVRALRDTAELTQADLLNDLTARRDVGEVQQFEAYWIANIIRVDATEDVLREIAARPDVMRVYYNLPIGTIDTIDEDPRAELDRRGRDGKGAEGYVPIGSIEPGVSAVRAPEVWNLGYTGQGVLIATMDTGVDGNHPAVASRWRGLDPQYSNNPDWAWFDPITSTSFPTEFGGSSHGTHTMGTVLGGLPGDQIGVAPGAQWIHAGVIDRGGIDATIANAILSFQWMAAPTGNPGDSWAVPRVCSNSWGTTSGMGHPNCDQTFWQWIDNSEAAGTIQFFSAGNEGGSGLRRPADRAITEYQSVAVAAIDPYNSNWPIAGFSSRGPTSCTPSGAPAIKPDIAAPGVDTRSAVSGGGYGSKSGTSMASPHVNGVAALMLEACDSLTVEEVKQIIYDTAFDLGSPGKDNDYGHGMIDALEAVNLAIAQCTIGVKIPNGVPSLLDPGVATSFQVEVVEGSESVVPGSERLYYSIDGGSFQDVALAPNGNGMYTATLPAAACDNVLQFYVQVEGDGGSVRTNPNNAPQNSFTALVGDYVTVEIYNQDFASGLPAGWTTSGLWNVTSNCPVSGECAGSQWAYYGQPSSCNFNTGSANSGEMVSSSINLPSVPAGGTMTLTFCYTLDGESSSTYDRATFGIEGESSTLLSNSTNDWSTFSMNVTEYAGQSVNLRWHFDTVDSVLNNGRGWQVNNIRITTTALECEDPQPQCPGDLTNDGTVDVSDLLQLLSAWGPCTCSADLNADGTVDVSDLLQVLAAWGSCN